MNNLSLSIVSIIAYNVDIRETLEYTIPKEKFSLEAYMERKKRILGDLESKTALRVFLDNNKENGKKIEDKIRELYANIYADDSTICRVANNELRVDASQHLSVYDSVIELHDDIKRIIDGNIGFARSTGMFEEELMKLVAADERMYRAIAFNCLFHDLGNLFFEYNKARNEAKGEHTPQSNFIQGELQRIVKHIMYVKEHQSITDRYYWEMVDYMVRIIDWTAGKRQLPEGKNFQDVFNDGARLIEEHLSKYREEWAPLFKSNYNELVETAKKNNGNIEIKIEKK